MAPLEHGNSRDNYHGGVTYRQPIGKQISYRFYKRTASFNGYYYKEDFLDWLLNLDAIFDYENTYCKVVIYNYIFVGFNLVLNLIVFLFNLFPVCLWDLK